jgi:site-specific DNA-cytosine methylase
MVAFGEYVDDGTASAMKARDYKDATDLVAQPVAVDIDNCNLTGDCAGNILAEAQMRTNKGMGVMQPVAFTTEQTPKFNLDQALTLTKQSPTGGGQPQAVMQPVAFAQNQRDEVRTMEIAGALAAQPGAKQQTYLHQAMQVRRLTPTECERLQGFPDGYTNIPWRNKSECPDGPRYKALGNSMAVPVMQWIGKRINNLI